MMTPNSKDIRRMFDDIAPTYDRLNHLLSFGFDIVWRRKAAREVLHKNGGRFLDLAAGTGDLSLAARCGRPQHIVALDFAFRTLTIAQEKFRKARQTEPKTLIECLNGDALRLPFRNSSFDAVLVAFGVRNFPDQLRCLQEMYRVLQPSGIACILELSRPHGILFAPLFHVYFHSIVPFIGRLVSGNSNAYRYLPESVDSFPDPTEFCSRMHQAGFRLVTSQPLTFGTASLYTGTK